MRTRRKALLAGVLALAAFVALLLLQDDEARPQDVKLAAIVPKPARQAPRAPGAATAAAPQSAAAPAAPAPPIFDLVRVEKDEVCEGEENLVTVHAHTVDGNDAFLHYTVAGEAGAQVPVRAYLGRDGKPAPQYAVAFSRDNVATRIGLPSYRVKNCRPARILTVTMRMLPNSSGEREFTAIVQALDGAPFTPAWYEWSFGDDSFDSTAAPVAVHDYSRLPQRTAFTDLLVKVKALDGGGQSVEGRFALQIRNVAFHTRQRGVATIFAEPSPRFPAAGPDGIVRQKFRLWHAEDAPVQITGATLARLFLPASPGSPPPPPDPVAVDHALFPSGIPAGEAREQAMEYDFGADPAVYAVVYELQGISAAGMPARGEITMLRPQLRPTRENSVSIDDPAMIQKIRRAMAILNQPTVSQEDLSRLEREGKLR
jgi:hypothetical protein